MRMYSIADYLNKACPDSLETIDLKVYASEIIKTYPKPATSPCDSTDSGYTSDKISTLADTTHNTTMYNNRTTLLIDGTSTYNMFYPSIMNWIHGGQFIEVRDNVKAFVSTLRASNIEPIYYFEGGATKYLRFRPDISMRTVTRVQDILQFIASHQNRDHDFGIDAGSELVRRFRKIHRPPHLMTLVELALRLECNVETRRNVTDDLVREMVAMYRCLTLSTTFPTDDIFLGIVSSNTDFMFHIPTLNLFYVGNSEKERHNFFANHICQRFHQDRLSEHTGLTLHQIPLLSNLLGNKLYIDRDSLLPLHNYICHGNSLNIHSLIPSLVTFIHDIFDVENPRQSYERIESFLYGITPELRASNPASAQRVGDMCECCRKYMLPWSFDLDETGKRLNVFAFGQDIMTMAKRRATTTYHNPFIYNLMNGSLIRNPILLESRIYSDGIPLTYILYRPLLQRFCGLLLQLGASSSELLDEEYKGESRVRESLLPLLPQKVFSTTTHSISLESMISLGLTESHLDEGEKTFVTSPIIPIVPKLNTSSEIDTEVNMNIKELWTGHGQKTDTMRWRALLACYSSNIPIHVISRIHPVYVPLCLIINYLVSPPLCANNNFTLDRLEVRALLLQALFISMVPRTSWDNVNFLQLKWPRVRNIVIATILVYGIKLFYTALGICGYPIQLSETLLWNYFDGKLFHSIIHKLNGGQSIYELCTGNEAVINKLVELENVIYNGSHG